MRLNDLFYLSVNNIKHRKMRAWLTLLGIVIGIAALVAIISLGQGLSSSINTSLGDFGTDMLTITPGFTKASSGFSRNFSTDSPNQPVISSKNPTLTNKDILTIRKNSNIKSVLESVSASLDVEFLSGTSKTSVQGINPQYWDDFFIYEFDSGRKLSVSDSYNVVIGYKIANERFDSVITTGRKIIIDNKPFTVIGILKKGESDNTILVPLDVMWGMTSKEKNTYSSLQAKLIDAEKTQETVDALNSALLISRKVSLKDKDFTLNSPLAMQEQIQTITGTMTLFLAAISAVSLIVGAIGIANSMFTSVLEKTKEIGIMKSLGATNGEILKMFIIESALFGFIGGVIGVIVGIGGSLLLGIVLGSVSKGQGPMGSNVLTIVTPELIIGAILLSVLIGVVSGLVPARSASKLNPIDALRYE
ncbi:MAG: ABC transporter permease [Candidatus ainarchaeum sp.]|nr:ABC transporter permease [Candidatus ainarchaeum sp.]